MTPFGHALASVVLRAEAFSVDNDLPSRERDRLRRLADRAERAAGLLTFTDALVYVQASHVESEPLPLRRTVAA